MYLPLNLNYLASPKYRLSKILNLVIIKPNSSQKIPNSHLINGKQ